MDKTNLENAKKEWERKMHEAFGASSDLAAYISFTLENFAHRYLANDTTPAPRVEAFGRSGQRVCVKEANMGQAFKTQNPKAREGIKDLAKRVPRTEHPAVLSGLFVEIHDLSPERGHLSITARIDWDFPKLDGSSANKVEKRQDFKWSELQQFRKGFPLALEEVCDLFL